MGITAIENRINKLQAIEAQQDELEAQAEALRDEIKDIMETRGVEELHTKNFVVNWRKIVSNRFDIRAFRATMPDLYQQFIRSSSSRRFTIDRKEIPVKTLAALKKELAPKVVTIQYKGRIVAIGYFSSTAGKWVEATVWQPMATEGPFPSDPPLENITEWERERFSTEGEALMAAFQFIDTL